MDKIVIHKINVIANNHQKNLKLNNPALEFRNETRFILIGIILCFDSFRLICM